MGLIADLGYALSPQNPVQRQIVRFASTRPISRLNRRIIGPLDRLVLGLTGGKSTLTSLVSGIPPLWLTATGARSGSPRTVPLLGFPVGEGIGLIGTSFGQTATPAWVHNLDAHPEASVSYRGKRIGVTARPADPAEEEAVWERAVEIYPGYASYGEWAGHRHIRVFILDESGPIDSGAGRVGS